MLTTETQIKHDELKQLLEQVRATYQKEHPSNTRFIHSMIELCQAVGFTTLKFNRKVQVEWKEWDSIFRFNNGNPEFLLEQEGDIHQHRFELAYCLIYFFYESKPDPIANRYSHKTSHLYEAYAIDFMAPAEHVKEIHAYHSNRSQIERKRLLEDYFGIPYMYLERQLQ